VTILRFPVDVIKPHRFRFLAARGFARTLQALEPSVEIGTGVVMTERGMPGEDDQRKERR
jgi:hypothetical protein